MDTRRQRCWWSCAILTLCIAYGQATEEIRVVRRQKKKRLTAEVFSVQVQVQVKLPTRDFEFFPPMVPNRVFAPVPKREFGLIAPDSLRTNCIAGRNGIPVNVGNFPQWASAQLHGNDTCCPWSAVCSFRGGSPMMQALHSVLTFASRGMEENTYLVTCVTGGCCAYRNDVPMSLFLLEPLRTCTTRTFTQSALVYLTSGQQVTITSSMRIQERACKSSEHVISTLWTDQAQNKLAKSAPMLEAEVLSDLASVFSLFSLDYTRPMLTLPKSPSLYWQSRTMNSASSTMHTATNLIASAS